MRVSILALVRSLRAFVCAATIAATSACAAPGAPQGIAAPAATAVAVPATNATYAALADEAMAALLQSYYAGSGLWRDCPEQGCHVHNGDWGSDSLTETIYLRSKTTGDPAMLLLLAELASTARTYGPACRGSRCLLWSDVPMWDSIAASREHEVNPRDSIALIKAKAAFWAVEDSEVYALGACPAIRYQRPFGRGGRLKTLETDSNGIKAALLLFEATRENQYLAIAQARYRSVRRYFLDAQTQLYSVYVFDDGKHCTQVPHRYFASVNGNMIWSGVRLAQLSGRSAYGKEARATALAVGRYLSDPNGVFTDLQAENDLEVPLIEAMFDAATIEHDAFARAWVLRSAAAAYSARRNDGTYGRFFDGPPPVATTTAWQTNGGFAAEIAAASLAPSSEVKAAAWKDATFVSSEIARLPATVRFNGSGIAFMGTIGEVCCERGHARVFVDGIETTNNTGMWQNKSSSGKRFANSVLFAWRWPTPGLHSVTFKPGSYNAKEGGSFFHARGYSVLDPATISLTQR